MEKNGNLATSSTNPNKAGSCRLGASSNSRIIMGELEIQLLCCDAGIARHKERPNGEQDPWDPKLCAMLVEWDTSLADFYLSTDLLPAQLTFLTSIPIPTKKFWKCGGKGNWWKHKTKSTLDSDPTASSPVTKCKHWILHRYPAFCNTEERKTDRPDRQMGNQPKT